MTGCSCFWPLLHICKVQYNCYRVNKPHCHQKWRKVLSTRCSPLPVLDFWYDCHCEVTWVGPFCVHSPLPLPIPLFPLLKLSDKVTFSYKLLYVAMQPSKLWRCQRPPNLADSFPTSIHSSNCKEKNVSKHKSWQICCIELPNLCWYFLCKYWVSLALLVLPRVVQLLLPSWKLAHSGALRECIVKLLVFRLHSFIHRYI